MSYVLVRALSRRGQNAGPKAAGQIICGRHDGAESVQRGGKEFHMLLLESCALSLYTSIGFF